MQSEKVLYVGVSPKPYTGCNYWYLDESGLTKPKTYVWVKMGRHQREQIVYVDSILWCNKENAPYPYEKVLRVLKQTTEEESKISKNTWFDTIFM